MGRETVLFIGKINGPRENLLNLFRTSENRDRSTTSCKRLVSIHGTPVFNGDGRYCFKSLETTVGIDPTSINTSRITSSVHIYFISYVTVQTMYICEELPSFVFLLYKWIAKVR